MAYNISERLAKYIVPLLLFVWLKRSTKLLTQKPIQGDYRFLRR